MGFKPNIPSDSDLMILRALGHRQGQFRRPHVEGLQEVIEAVGAKMIGTKADVQINALGRRGDQVAHLYC